MTFATPALLWVAAAAPVAVLALHVFDRVRRRQLARRLGELPLLGTVTASASPGRRALKDALAALGLGLVLLAAARPQVEGKRRVELRGLDVVIALDASKSMLVDDVGATAAMAKKQDRSRLARARELAIAVIDELPGDRVGPVVFAGAAASFPLTEDHQVAARFLSDLGPTDLPPGSNLGQVFKVGRCLLRPDLYEDLDCAKIGRRGRGGDPLRGESLDPPGVDGRAEEGKLEEKIERGRAMVIFTDGGDVDAEIVREVEKAASLGIAVFLVGVGTAAGGVVYEVDPFSGKRGTTPKQTPSGQSVTSRRDDAGMAQLAEAGGDARRYLVAGETGEVDPMPIVEALRAVNRGLATKEVKDRRDVFQPFLFAGFMLLVIEAAISTRRRRRFPEAR